MGGPFSEEGGGEGTLPPGEDPKLNVNATSAACVHQHGEITSATMNGSLCEDSDSYPAGHITGSYKR